MLREYQTQAITSVRKSLSNGNKRVMLALPTGAGKCLGIDTPLLMFNGAIKKVQDVRAGDLLMGPDSKPRKVLSTCRGIEKLYRVTPKKGATYIVNESHILSLQISGNRRVSGFGPGEIVNISVRDYLAKTKEFKHCAKGWRTGVDFNKTKQHTDMPPYILGLWLGDGTSKYSAITTSDIEVKSAWEIYAESCGLQITARDGNNCETLFATNGRRGGMIVNRALNALRDIGVYNNKHIPIEYKACDREARLEILAGIIDTDGHNDNNGYDLVFKQKALSDDVAFIARSLGLAAYVRKCRKGIRSTGFESDYWRISISGDTSILPCRVARKKAGPRKQIKSVLRTGISVTDIGIGDYYGFELDGDRLFLLGDFTVTHNTKIASTIIQSALKKGNRVIFCVNAISLVDQTIQAFYNEGIHDIGVLQGNHEMTNRTKAVQVCSVQTLMRRKIPEASLVIIDEAHNWFKFYAKWFAEWSLVPFIGLSATPWTKGLANHYSDLIIGATTQDLIDDGYLSDFVAFAPSHPDLKGVRTLAGDYHEGDLGKAMDKAPLVADIVQTWIDDGENRPTLCYAVNCAHAQHIQAQFEKAGIPCGYIDAFTEIEDRREIAKKFHEGELKVIANVGVLTTGIDWDVRCIILARPTKSEILFVQIIGRGLRKAEGKDHCLIFDHSDTTSRLGLVTDIHYTELCDGSKKDKEKQAKEKEEKLPKECPKCARLKPAGLSVCPSCGFEAKAQSNIEQVDGELIEIKARKKNNKTYTPEQKEKFYGELRHYGGKHGYKQGWASNQYRKRFDVWPNKYRDAKPTEASPETLSWIKSQQIRYSKRKTA